MTDRRDLTDESRPALPPCLRVETYERDRPAGPQPTDARTRSRLTEVHDYFRQLLCEMKQSLRSDESEADLGPLQRHLATLSCRQYCTAVTLHHFREDNDLFPALATADARLVAVLSKLGSEHHAIHRALEFADEHARTATRASDLAELRVVVEALADVIASHFAYEEHELGLVMNGLDQERASQPVGPHPRPSEQRIGYGT